LTGEVKKLVLEPRNR